MARWGKKGSKMSRFSGEPAGGENVPDVGARPIKYPMIGPPVERRKYRMIGPPGKVKAGRTDWGSRRKNF